MPKSKLTLSIDPDVIERAKRFSERNETTVSELVQDFLASLDDLSEMTAPITARLRGILPGDVDREDYREHLRRKHG